MKETDPIRKLLDLTNRKIGSNPSTPADFNELSLRINKATRHPVSPSTLKRLWGYVPYKSLPSKNTLNTLSIFIGFKGWNDFLSSNTINPLQDEISGFFENMEIIIDDLMPGQVVHAEWNPNKSCKLKYLGESRFRVIQSANIKLLPEDCLTIRDLKVGSPFYALDIERGEERIPGYLGARDLGISRLKLESC